MPSAFTFSWTHNHPTTATPSTAFPNKFDAGPEDHVSVLEEVPGLGLYDKPQGPAKGRTYFGEILIQGADHAATKAAYEVWLTLVDRKGTLTYQIGNFGPKTIPRLKLLEISPPKEREYDTFVTCEVVFVQTVN